MTSLAHRGALAALLLTTALAAAACGGSSGSASTNGTTTTTAAASGTGATSAAMAKFTACLSQHGVTLPSGGGGAGGAPPTGTPPTGTSTTARPQGGGASFQQAMTACAKLRPAGQRAGGFAGPGGGANSAAFAAYRNCLTLHGAKAGALSLAPGATPSAATKKAMTACASLRPARQAPTGTAPATGTS